MKILSVDTSTTVASCAVINKDETLSEGTVSSKTTHSQKLLPLIADTLDRANIDIEEIDYFAVANGPGSFTGLRIGVSTINGLAQALDKPVVAISSLKALAMNISTCEKLLVPLIDARRDRSFTGVYKSDLDGKLETLLEEDVREMDEILDILDKKQEDIMFIGDGMNNYREKIVNVLGDRAYFTPNNLNIAKASSVGELAKVKIEDGQTMSYFDLRPEYLRETQAQRELDEKMRKQL